MPSKNPNNHATRFKPGGPGGPGRRKGGKNKLGEAFLIAMEDDFKLHGPETIRMAREKDPVAYVRVLAGLLPADVNLNVNHTDDMTDDELIERMRDLAQHLGPLIGVPGFGGGAEAEAEAQSAIPVSTLQ